MYACMNERMNDLIGDEIINEHVTLTCCLFTVCMYILLCCYVCTLVSLGRPCLSHTHIPIYTYVLCKIMKLLYMVFVTK